MEEMKINISDNLADQRARAEQLIGSLSGNYAGHNGNFIPEWTKAYEKDLGLITSALADERRRALGEAAKMICPYCNDPEWITYNPEGDHISPHTGNMFVCRSHKIRVKAHAGQEG